MTCTCREPMPPPKFGGRHGLLAAAKESADLDRRTVLLVKSGATSEWIREYKRIRNIK